MQPVIWRGIKTYVQDVYKKTNFKLDGLKAKDHEQILAKIKEAKTPDDLKEIFPKSKLGSIMAFKAHLEAEGRPLTTVEQLLDIKGFKSDQLERYCNKIVQQGLLEQSQSQSISKPKLAKKLLNRTVPALKEENKAYNSIVGFKFDMLGLYYSHISYSSGMPGHLEAWNFHAPFNDLLSKTSFQHHNLVESAKELVDVLPQAPVYVYEEVPRILPRDPVLKMKLRNIVLEAALISTLAASRPNVDIFSLKYNAANEEFKLKIGDERMEVAQKLQSRIEESELQRSSLEPLMEAFRGFERLKREVLAESLLVSLTFKRTLDKLAKLNT